MIRISKTKDTPEIILDKQNNVFEIRGRSLPEDADKFYSPILEWIENYVKDPNPETVLTVDLEYFNSSSIKQLVILFVKLQSIVKTENKVKIIWSYPQNDELIEVKGQELKSILTVTFELNAV